MANGAFQQILTDGSYLTEDAGKADLDNLATQSGCFRIHREVVGYYVQPRFLAEYGKQPRIDRIFVPTAKLIDAGWEHGPIGIECKVSGEPIGKAVSQSLDYSRATWRLPHGFNIQIDWVFLWPVSQSGGDIGSVMAQNRIGYVTTSNRRLLTFSVCGTNAITIERDGTVATKRLTMGYKCGSR